MVYGYSRCSTNETKQDINRQVRKLKAAGAEEIFMEYEHGDAKIKSQQQAMFAQAQPGDTITVLEVSRLARSTQQLCEIIDLVREKHLRQPDPISEAFLQMAGGQSAGAVYDTNACAVWYGKRQSKGKADRQTPTHRRKHSRNLSSALSRL